MSLLVESIKLKDGVIQNLEYHQQRLNQSMKELFPLDASVDLDKELSGIQLPGSGIYKIRVVYGPSVEKIEVESYFFRSINNLKLVFCNDVDYHLKFTDRHVLNELYNQRANCDDIIIVKGEAITDSFSANLLFFDGKQWLTPHTPLLKGTKRKWLLENGLIFERPITVNDLTSYQKVGLINAMIDFDEMPIIDINDIC